MIGPRCNINAQGHVYVLVKIMDNTATRRLYFFKSMDYGDTWTVVQIASAVTPVLTPIELRVGAFRGSSPYTAGQVIYAFYAWNLLGDVGIKVSVNQGALWGAQIPIPWCGASSQTQYFGRSPADQDTVYAIIKGATLGPTFWMNLRKTVNRGNTWTDLMICNTIPPNPQVTQHPNTYIWNPGSAFMAGGTAGLHWTENDWATYITHTNTNNFNVDGCSRVMDYPENLYGWQGGNPGPGDMQHVIAVSSTRGDQWEGKAGSDPVTPDATSIPNNCGGVAQILQIWI